MIGEMLIVPIKITGYTDYYQYRKRMHGPRMIKHLQIHLMLLSWLVDYTATLHQIQRLFNNILSRADSPPPPHARARAHAHISTRKFPRAVASLTLKE